MKKIFASLLSFVCGLSMAASTTIGGFTPNDPVYTAYDYTAWGWCSVVLNGTQYIDCYDHGRGLQSAVVYDNLGENNNPTQEGTLANGVTPNASSSVNLLFRTNGNASLSTRTQMAYWKPVGGVVLSNTIFTEITAARYLGHDAVAKFYITFTTPPGETHTAAQFEVLTGYMPPAFNTFYTYNPATQTLASLSPTPRGEQPLPIVFCTSDNTKCMGVYSLNPLTGGGYGRWLFSPSECTTSAGNTGCSKWNAVSRVNNPTPGTDYNFTIYTFVGTLAAVKSEMNWVHTNRP